MDKIYVYDNEGGASYSTSPTNNIADKKHEIEYVRKEAILKWAREVANDANHSLVYRGAFRDLINKINSL